MLWVRVLVTSLGIQSIITKSHLEGLVCSACSVSFCYRLSFLFCNETGFYGRAENGRAVVEILNSKSFAVFTENLLISK